MGKKREPTIFDDNPFIDDLLDWAASPEGQAAGEASDLVDAILKHASVDARRRKIIWPDGKRLSIEQSAKRIEAEYPDVPRELIEDAICIWLEHCVPESFSEHQIAELDQLVGPWISDHQQKSSTAEK